MAGLARPCPQYIRERLSRPGWPDQVRPPEMARRSCEGGLGDVSNTAIPHAGLRVLPAVFPSRRPFRCRRLRRRLLLRRLNRK